MPLTKHEGVCSMMVYSAIKGAVPFIGGVTLHWPAWLLISGVGIGGLIGMSWDWCWKRYRKRHPDPHVILRELRSPAGDLYHIRIDPDNGWVHDGHLRAAELEIQAEQIGIKCPPLDQPKLWMVWLEKFIPLANTDSLKRARELK